jgi:hypothetical protein
MKHKLVRMRLRKGIWLFDFDQIKYERPFHYVAYLVLGLGALIFGSILAWTMYGRWDHESVLALLEVLIVPVAMIAFGIMLLPLGALYFVRRAKRDAVDVWTAERPDETDAPEEDHHGSNDH